MLDTAVGYTRFRFLGHEYLTWLWFRINTDADVVDKTNASFTEISVGSRIVFENHEENSLEKITIKGDDPSFEEGKLAIRKGALITEIQLQCKEGAHDFSFSIKGENFGLSGVKVPTSGSVEFPEDQEGAILERLYLFEKITTFIQASYSFFLQKRVSKKWDAEIIPCLKEWLQK